MIHCTMDDLLALRAGEGSAWARQHATGCAACRAELEALYQRVAQLKALPARRPARDRWPAVRDGALVERRRRRGRWAVSGLAAAAALAGLLVFRPFWTKPVDAAELSRVKEQSATLEQQLQRYDPDGRATSAAGSASWYAPTRAPRPTSSEPRSKGSRPGVPRTRWASRSATSSRSSTARRSRP